MYALQVIGLVVLGLVAAVFLVALFLPASWKVERSVEIAAPRAAVYPYVASFRHGWIHWNPWAAERGMKMSYAGPESGVGAMQTWSGGETDGGTMMILEADEPARVMFDLAFGPFTITGRFELLPTDGGTRLRWINTGDLPGFPLFRYGGLFAQRVVGRAMERGLRTLCTRIAEAPVHAAA